MTALIWFAAWRLIRLLPENTAYSLFKVGGKYVYRKNGRGIQRLRRNLKTVKPEITEEEIAAAVQSYLRYWCDTFRSPDWSKDRLQKTVTIIGKDLLMPALTGNKAVIVALPHSGNWDHAGAYYCSLGFKVTTVAERLKPEAVFKAFLNYRKALGMEVLPLEPRVIAALSKRLQENGFVALVADRDLTDSGIEVTFFGKTAKMPAGPAALAIKTGALLLAAHVSYTDSGIAIEFEEIASNGSVQEVTQKMANFFEKTISKRPTDWHMLQRIWINDDL
jgi:lauroyl/myristoyl acyltransferase